MLRNLKKISVIASDIQYFNLKNMLCEWPQLQLNCLPEKVLSCWVRSKPNYEAVRVTRSVNICLFLAKSELDQLFITSWPILLLHCK